MKITDKYVFFWKSDDIYSQWYQIPMIIDGVTYQNSEQYMMHEKAMFFNDFRIATEIMKTSDPKDIKHLGRQVSNFDRDKWNEVCMSVVYKGNYAKFSQNEELKKEMLSTGDKIFSESSPLDKVWGIGMGSNELGVENPANWKGQNLLGWVLQLVKQELKNI